MTELLEHLCKVCRTDISKLAKHAIYCGDTCRGVDGRMSNPLNHSAHPFWGKHVTGSISELRVAIDLLGRGFEVYKAIGSYGKCDLAAIRNHSVYRIEVKTAHVTRKGNWNFGTPKNNAYDILALVTHDGSITYRPELPCAL